MKDINSLNKSKVPEFKKNTLKVKKENQQPENKLNQSVKINLNQSLDEEENFDIILSPKRIENKDILAQNKDNFNENEYKNIQNWKKERLEKELKCLFYKARRSNELLKDSI